MHLSVLLYSLLLFCLPFDAMSKDVAKLSPDGFFEHLANKQAENSTARREYLEPNTVKKYPKLAEALKKPLRNGKVTKQEFLAEYAAYRQSFNSFFQKLDKNGDGLLSYSEIVAGAPALLRAFDSLDKDRNGRLDRAELRDSPVVFTSISRKATDANISNSTDEIEGSASGEPISTLTETSQNTVIAKGACNPPECEEIVVGPPDEEPDYFWEIIIIIIIVDDGACKSSSLATLTTKQSCPAPPVDRAKELQRCYEGVELDYQADIARCEQLYTPSSPSIVQCYSRATEYYAEGRSICRQRWS
jgi:hypothetical protein